MPPFISWPTKRWSNRANRIGDRACMWMAIGILIFMLTVAGIVVLVMAAGLLLIAVTVGMVGDTWRAAGTWWTSRNRKH